MDCAISRPGSAFLQTPLAPFPARLCAPGPPPASRSQRQYYTQRTYQRLAPTEAAGPAAAAAAGMPGMAADGLGALREFKLTLPAGVDPAAPLVVVLGWYGCQDKHLSKYSSLLERQGYPSLRGILPGHAVFAPFVFPRRRWAARLLDAVAAVDPEGQRPVVLYAFSNGGCFVVEQIDQLVKEDPRYRPFATRIAGLAFDSAPCYMSLRVGATAIGFGMPWPLRVLAALAFFISVLLMMPLEPLRPWVYWRNMRQLSLGRRSLYLFSDDDPLCLPDKLEDLIAARRAAGADVQVVRWERSQHVGHLLKHYKEYTAALFGFLASLAA